MLLSAPSSWSSADSAGGGGGRVPAILLRGPGLPPEVVAMLVGRLMQYLGMTYRQPSSSYASIRRPTDAQTHIRAQCYMQYMVLLQILPTFIE